MKAKDELQKLIDNPSYHDVIWSVFALAGRSFTNDRRKIYDFFHKWRDKMPHGKEIFFSERPPLCYSEQVANAITILLGSIYFWVPNGDKYFWHKGVRVKFVKRMHERFSKREISTIEEMAKEFRELK